MMNYFITDILSYTPTGIEHAQIMRLRLFNQHGVPAQILTTIYNRFLALNCFRAKVDAKNMLNVNDYLQRATEYSGPRMTLSDWPVTGLSAPVRTGNTLYYYQGAFLAAKVTLFNPDSGYPYAHDQIDNIEYHDQQGNITFTDFYDVRGFKSMTYYFGHIGGVQLEQFWTPDGELAYENAYDQDEDGHNHLNRITVYGDGNPNVFETRDELVSHVMRRINKADQHAVFFSDRPTAADKPLFMAPAGEMKIYIVRHSAHTYDRNDPMHSKFNDVVQNEINYQQHIRGFITATDRQRDDIHNRTGINAWTAPVGYSTDGELNAPVVPLSERNPVIITASRVHPEKQLDQLIEAFRQVKKHVANAKLLILGDVTDQQYYRQLLTQIQRDRLDDSVNFGGYTTDLITQFNHARAYVTTGEYEAFNISLQQALASGLPAAAYDVHYGIREQITDGANGYLLPLNDVDGLAKKMTVLLKNDEQWQQLSSGAKKLARRYGTDEVWQSWQQVLNQQ